MEFDPIVIKKLGPMAIFSFDFFPKFIDSAMIKRTNLGAVISIAMVLAAATLCLSETASFLNPVIKEQLVSVSDLRGSLSELTISFNVTVSLPCVLTHLDVFDIVGTPNDSARKTFFKMRVDQEGRFIKSTVVAPQCGNCYGAETPEKNCCNSCEEVVEAYEGKSWGISDFDMWSQCKEEGIDLLGGERCRVYGALHVNAIEGTFHIAPGINVRESLGHQHDMTPLLERLNLSHEIDHLAMGASFGQSPLDRTRVV
jgi:hypothetical protein